MVRYDASLEEEFLKLKQVLVQLSYNPLLQSFEQGNLALLDRTAPVDDFVREKKKLILKHIMRHGVDFDPELKSAYDEYSEALTWIWLKKKVRNIERVPESKIKTPDFKVTVNADQGHQEADQIVYAELKSMSFADGNLNYKQVMQDALDEQIKMDKQRANGNRVSQGVYIISPLYKRNKDYDHSSTRYAIETLIERSVRILKKISTAWVTPCS
ncbi:hypothetical protein [Mucilaginibacter sp. SJ]|uniref:hypothetical protein n=1 Tax=Mucilaginibacter sp. SJ TaxID=3029053 RepID=UPI0023AA17AA|nr:hypothetical protein [Mucilaginibacter sp. SJ]WEA01782.1 hypothetical protein MusilaSJ_02450 [Mucilaginibacter sp. SJ]